MKSCDKFGSIRDSFGCHRILLFLILAFSALGCSDLSVFVPNKKNATISDLNSVKLTDEGRLSLEWATNLTSSTGSYDIYLLEVDPQNTVYQFSDNAVYDEALVYELVNVDAAKTPRKTGTLLDKVQSLSFVVQDLLTSGKTYAIEIIDSRSPLKMNSRIVLVRIDFVGSFTGSALSDAGSSHLVWNKVPGANRYEVYADEALTQKLGESLTNELTVRHPATGVIKDYYIKAFRGLLPAQNITKISLSNSLAKVVKVEATSPDGNYRAGDTLDFVVKFSQKITSFGEPALPLQTKSKKVLAEYVNGSGSDTLRFQYLVSAGDDVERLTSGSVLEGEFVDEFELAVAANLPIDTSPDSLKRSSAIAIDTIAPTAPHSIGFTSATSLNGNVDISWTASTDLHFFQHRLKLCSDVNCSTGCGSEQAVSGNHLSLLGLAEGTYYACVRGEDTFGNVSLTNASLTPVKVDSTAPKVVRVFAQSAAGNYALGSALTLAVKFDEAVNVVGNLQLTLDSGGTPHEATLVSGSGTDTLLFNYVVQSDDHTSDLNYLDASSLALAGAGSVKDLAGNNAVLTLPATTDTNSLAGQSAIVIDGVVPTVMRVYAISSDGSYTAPQTLTLAIQMNEAVHLTHSNNLRLALQTGTTTRYATYSSGDGTDTLQFSYTVGTGDENPDLDYAATTSLSFNGLGTLKDGVGNSGNLTLPAPGSTNSLAGQNQLLVDALSPTVVKVYSTSADGIYGTGSDIDIAVEMSEAVTLTNEANLSLQLESGTVDRFAVYDSVTGGNILHFRYTVVAGDVAGDLNYLSPSSLAFSGGGTMVDALGNAANLTLPALNSTLSLAGQSSISIDTSDFKVNRVYSLTVNGVANEGAIITIGVEFNKVVTVTDSGNLKLTLATGIIQRDANYVLGDGTNTLIFQYEVQAGDTSPDLNYSSSTSLTFQNGSSGTVTDPGSQVATLFLPSIGSGNSLAGQSAIVIDTLAPAVFRVYAQTANGAYKEGDLIQLAVEFTEAVTISGTGTMSLALDVGGTPRVADYTTPLDSKTLTFEYTVQAGDVSSDLDYTVTTALSKTGTLSLKDAATNEATLTLPAVAGTYSLAGQSDIVVDTTKPVVERVYSQTTNGGYKVGTTLALRVEFSEPVLVSAPTTMTLALATGTIHNATLVGGSGTNTLEFEYAIQAGDTASDLDYSATTALALTGGTTLKDAAGNDATLTLPALGSTHSLAGEADLVIDTTAPTVARVFAQTIDGTYAAPTVLNLIVEFSENVTVNDVNNLRLALALNASPRYATYFSGSGTNQIVMRYTIQTGDESPDLNYDSTSALSFSSTGSIEDAVGNVSLLVLPATGATESLAGQSAIVVDAVAPSAPLITSPVDNATVTSPITLISGTAEANSTVQIFKDSVSQGTVTADGSGNWSHTFSSALLNGTYTLAATATDSVSNVSSQASITVTVAIPMPTSNAGADVSTAASVTLSGTTTNAVSRLWTKVSGSGTISFGSASSDTTSVSASAEGTYTLRLTATNANGDVVSDDMIFTWDTSAPNFIGLQNITQASSTSSRLFWAGAIDTYTNDKDIIYELCSSTTPGSCASNFVVSETFPSNVYDYTATGLTAGTNYEFLLRAVDKAGNSSVGGGAINNLGLRNVMQLASGGYLGCALLSDQTVKCWGANESYQLGQGGTDVSERQNPVTVSGLTNVRRIAVGNGHACAILNDDSVKCWGKNAYGELGDGTTTNRSTPVVAAVSNVQDLALGDGMSCALIKVTGTVQCWGRGNFGTLGDGNFSNSLTPVNVSGLSGVTAISLGTVTACAIMSDKTIRCWGRGLNGELGVNGNSNSAVPLTSSISNVEQLDISDSSVCAVLSSGAAQCWGKGEYGRLGNGSETNKAVPTDVTGLSSGVSKVLAGYPFHCALMVDQTVKCWGDGTWGAMANDTLASELTPRTIPGLSGVVELSLANDTACARLNDNAVKCWGRDDYGQAGDGAVFTRVSPATVVGLGGTPLTVESGIDHSCVLLSDKTVKCWGSGENGYLGDSTLGTSFTNTYPEPHTVTGLTDVEVLKVGGYHTCAILTDTTVKCWGANASGQLGNNATTNSALAQTVVSTSGSGSLSGIVDIMLGKETTCAITAAGAMYCWGAGKNGLLGDGRTSVNSSVPVLATQFTQAIRTGAIGLDHLCVILNDTNKTVQCVGANSKNQLADGTTNSRTAPYSTTTGALSISSKDNHTCIVTAAQTMKCWGSNNLGQFGIGDYAAYSSVKTVSNIGPVSSISLGHGFSCAVLTDSSTFCWGENDNDRLGLPWLTANSNQNLPQAVSGLTGVAKLAAGLGHVCALMQDATVKCWGYNNRSQTGVSRQDTLIMLPSQEISSGKFGD